MATNGERTTPGELEQGDFAQETTPLMAPQRPTLRRRAMSKSSVTETYAARWWMGVTGGALGLILIAGAIVIIVLHPSSGSGGGGSGRGRAGDDTPDYSKLPGPQPGGRNPSYLASGHGGAVASEVDVCSQIGVDVLKEGGTATDAGIAAALCIGTTNMFSSGIGGGGFMVIRPSTSHSNLNENCTRPIAIDFRESAPSAATPHMFSPRPDDPDFDPARASRIGGLAVGVPGELRGLEAAYNACGGGVSWRRLFEPSIKLARRSKVGKELSRRLNSAIFTKDPMSAWMLDQDEWREVFAPAGRLLVQGETLRREAYAHTLDRVSKEGVDVFYTGDIAQSLVKAVQAAGGILTLEDFAAYAVDIKPAFQSTYLNRTMYTTHYPSAGPILANLLNTLETYDDFVDAGKNDLTMHRFVEALKFSFAARTEVGDPYFIDNAERLAEIPTKKYAKAVRANITDDRTHHLDYYHPRFDLREDHGTTHLSVIDQYGSAISLTSTVNLIFGSRVLDRDSGVILNDEMDDFSVPGVPNAFGLRPSPFNYPEGGKRPASSTSALIVESADGDVWLAAGGSGGSRIFGSVAQVLMHLDWGYDVANAVEQQRLHDQLLPQLVTVESGYRPDIVDGLRTRGHNITEFDVNLGVAEVQAVVRDSVTGKMFATSDSRKNGLGPAMFATLPTAPTIAGADTHNLARGPGSSNEGVNERGERPGRLNAAPPNDDNTDDSAMLASYLAQQHSLQQYFATNDDSSLDSLDPSALFDGSAYGHSSTGTSTGADENYMAYTTATGAIQGALMSSLSSHASSVSSPESSLHSRSATAHSPPFGVGDYSQYLSGSQRQQQSAFMPHLQQHPQNLHQTMFDQAPQTSFVSPHQVQQLYPASNNSSNVNNDMVYVAIPSHNAHGLSPISQHSTSFDSTPLSASEAMFAPSPAFFNQSQQFLMTSPYVQSTAHLGQSFASTASMYARPSPPSSVSPRNTGSSESDSHNVTTAPPLTKKRKVASDSSNKSSVQAHQTKLDLDDQAVGQAAATSASVGLIASAGMPAGGQKFAFAPAGAQSQSNDTDKSAAAMGRDSNKKNDKRRKSDAASAAEKQHNAVERRYRNNINNSLAALRDAIPALQHLKPLPSMPQSRRKASQFSIPSSATAATPQGLVDGVPAAKTLSKGSILSKAVEYIAYLQGARSDREEDVELFKQVVLETVSGGDALVQMFEERKAARDVERAAIREDERRREAEARGGDTDGSDDEDEDEEPKAKRPVKAAVSRAQNTSTARSKSQKADPTKRSKAPNTSQARTHPASQALDDVAASRQQQQLDALSQLREHLASGGTPLPPHLEQLMQQTMNHQPGTFPLSPASSSEDGVNVSPRFVSSAYPPHAVMPQRTLLATFVGLSFAGGIGYDLSTSSSSAVDEVGARAWSTRIVRRDVAHAAGSIGPAVFTGLAFLGAASIFITLLLILRPTVFTKQSGVTSQNVESLQSRSIYRQRRRADALASLARLKNASHFGPPTYETERLSALKARRELLKLVGAPTFGLLPSLLKEGLATLLRNTTTIRVGSFSRWTDSERTEAAVAWVRIAEIEATVGRDDVNYLARCYTFLRLFNLSHSKQWPETTPTTVLSAVNAVLAVHLLSLRQPLSALALWSKAVRQARNYKSALDVRPHAWADVALSVDFATVRALFAEPIDPTTYAIRLSSPSDSVPLLRISEHQCAAALREAWSKIFVSVIQTTCPPRNPAFPSSKFSSLADSQFLTETVDNVLEATVPGSVVHCLGLVTRSLCQVYFGPEDAGLTLARRIELDRRDGGASKRLSCTASFVRLVLGQRGYVFREDLSDEDDDDHQSASSEGVAAGTFLTNSPMLFEADLIAKVTLGWLLVRQQVVHSRSSSSSSSTTRSTPKLMKADPTLHRETMALRKLLSHDVFHDPHLSKFCSNSTLAMTPSSDAVLFNSLSTAVERTTTAETSRHCSNDTGVKFDLESALESCLDSLTSIMRNAAGLGDDDSGIECD
ncbi:hypothetical protein OIV83_004906 [Microbotryomycetes sp. JL201]|nr:hypothetical protein OIV83_004906 [Microbotryomycetes sp. JL201]